METIHNIDENVVLLLNTGFTIRAMQHYIALNQLVAIIN